MCDEGATGWIDGMTTVSFVFPGRWVEGAGLLLGPLLMLAGVLLRVEADGFFPAQLAAFATSPGRISLSYSAFVAGNVLLWPAVPLGVRVLKDGPAPRWWAYPLALAMGTAAVLLGMAG